MNFQKSNLKAGSDGLLAVKMRLRRDIYDNRFFGLPFQMIRKNNSIMVCALDSLFRNRSLPEIRNLKLLSLRNPKALKRSSIACFFFVSAV